MVFIGAADEVCLLLIVVLAYRSFDIGQSHNAFFPAFFAFAQRAFAASDSFLLFSALIVRFLRRIPDDGRDVWLPLL